MGGLKFYDTGSRFQYPNLLYYLQYTVHAASKWSKMKLNVFFFQKQLCPPWRHATFRKRTATASFKNKARWTSHSIVRLAARLLVNSLSVAAMSLSDCSTPCNCNRTYTSGDSVHSRVVILSIMIWIYGYQQLSFCTGTPQSLWKYYQQGMEKVYVMPCNALLPLVFGSLLCSMHCLAQKRL